MRGPRNLDQGPRLPFLSWVTPVHRQSKATGQSSHTTMGSANLDFRPTCAISMADTFTSLI